MHQIGYHRLDHGEITELKRGGVPLQNYLQQESQSCNF